MNSVSISADGRWALSGSMDKTLRLWELATGQCVRTFEGHTKWCDSVCISSGWALGAVGELRQDAAAVGAGHGPVCAHVRGAHGRR